MSVFQLQVLAMITMLCDHLADPFLGNSTILRCVGRLAFPIYALLIAEGFRHMKDNPKKIEKHLGDMVVLALVSEFCYDLLEAKPFSLEKIISSQNCIITLLLAFLGLIAIEKWKEHKVWVWSVVVLTAMMNYIAKSNYKFVGVLLVYAFYFYMQKAEAKSYLYRFGMLLLIFAGYLPLYHWARYDFCGWNVYIEKLAGANTWWYLSHILVAAILATYTGKLGFYSKKFKKVYRWFYPAHLLILGIVRQLFF